MCQVGSPLSDNDELRRNEITLFLIWWISIRNMEVQIIVFARFLLHPD